MNEFIEIFLVIVRLVAIIALIIYSIKFKKFDKKSIILISIISIITFIIFINYITLMRLTRIVLGALIISIILLILKKKKKLKKKPVIISIISVYVIISILINIPLEKNFITFSTAQKAFNYNASGKIFTSVKGDNSTFIISELNYGGSSYQIIYKNKSGYEMTLLTDTKEIYSKKLNNILIKIWRYKDTDENYISIIDFNSNKRQIIQDSSNSDFTFFLGSNGLYYYNSYLGDIKDDYYLIINGKKININV